jgi:hypothetical protein
LVEFKKEEIKIEIKEKKQFEEENEIYLFLKKLNQIEYYNKIYEVGGFKSLISFENIERKELEDEFKRIGIDKLGF